MDDKGNLYFGEHVPEGDRKRFEERMKDNELAILGRMAELSKLADHEVERARKQIEEPL